MPTRLPCEVCACSARAAERGLPVGGWSQTGRMQTAADCRSMDSRYHKCEMGARQ